MKVALIRQKYTEYGGAELYVNRLARRLVEGGHEVHILARRWSAAETGGVVFHRIRCPSEPAFVRLYLFARRAARIMAAEQFDLVHSFERTYGQDIFRAGDGCHREWLLRRARAEGPVRAAIDAVNPRHRAFLSLEARLFRDPKLKIVQAISRSGRDEIIRHYGVAPEKIRVLYNGVDRRRFHPGLRELHRDDVRKELAVDPDERLVLFVGSGYKRKGLKELIKAAGASDFKVVVAGKDDPSPYRRLARRCGAADRVVFTGPRTDVERLYGAADVFCLPSWFEPFGVVFLEALASGLPLVATEDVGGAEAVREGINGYTVSFPVDYQELAAKIEAALHLDRSALVERLDELLAPFDWEKNMRQTLEAYAEAAGRV